MVTQSLTESFIRAANLVVRSAKDMQTLANNLVAFMSEDNQDKVSECKASLKREIEGYRSVLLLLENRLKEL